MRTTAMLALRALSLTACLCRPARAEAIPVTRAKTLQNAPVVLPARSGKPLVLVVGFAKAARGEGVAWMKQLVAMERGGARFDFYQVAMLSGAPRFTHGLIARAIRASVPREYQSRVLLVADHEDDWRRTLHVTDDAQAYVLLCSADGEIVWRTRGLSPADMQSLQSELHTAVNAAAPHDKGAAASPAR